MHKRPLIQSDFYTGFHDRPPAIRLRVPADPRLHQLLRDMLAEFPLGDDGLPQGTWVPEERGFILSLVVWAMIRGPLVYATNCRLVGDAADKPPDLADFRRQLDETWPDFERQLARAAGLSPERN